MKEVRDFLAACGTFYLATEDGDQPRVRPFGVAEIIDGKLYLMTGKSKNVYKQLLTNSRFELCAWKPEGDWIRVSGKLVNDDRVEVKQELLNRCEFLKGEYSATDSEMAVMYIADGKATLYPHRQESRSWTF